MSGDNNCKQTNGSEQEDKCLVEPGRRLDLQEISTSAAASSDTHQSGCAEGSVHTEGSTSDNTTSPQDYMKWYNAYWAAYATNTWQGATQQYFAPIPQPEYANFFPAPPPAPPLPEPVSSSPTNSDDHKSACEASDDSKISGADLPYFCTICNIDCENELLWASHVKLYHPSLSQKAAVVNSSAPNSRGSPNCVASVDQSVVSVVTEPLQSAASEDSEQKSEPSAVPLTAGESFPPESVATKRQSADGVESLFCNACKIPYATAKAFEYHLKSKKHATRLAEMEKNPAQFAGEVYCDICTLTCFSAEMYSHHILTDGHLAKQQEACQKANAAAYCASALPYYATPVAYRMMDNGGVNGVPPAVMSKFISPPAPRDGGQYGQEYQQPQKKQKMWY